MKEAVKEAAHKGNTLLSDSSYIKLQKVQTKPYDRKQTVVAWGGGRRGKAGLQRDIRNFWVKVSHLSMLIKLYSLICEAYCV